MVTYAQVRYTDLGDYVRVVCVCVYIYIYVHIYGQ